MSDTYNPTDATALLTIYNSDTAEERSCTQAEFDETFEPAGWEIIEPVVDPKVLITVTNNQTGETKSMTGAEFLEKRAEGWEPTQPPAKPGRGVRRPSLRTEDRR